MDQVLHTEEMFATKRIRQGIGVSLHWQWNFAALWGLQLAFD